MKQPRVHTGFYPEHFEWNFFNRIGPLVALENDEDRLVNIMIENLIDELQDYKHKRDKAKMAL